MIERTSCALRGVERRRARRLVLRERRSGFDRRRREYSSPAAATFEAALLHLRDNPVTVATLLVAANLLSLLDLVLTLQLLRAGAVEGNPIMASFLEAGPAQAAVFKMGVVALAAAVFWGLRRHRVALTAVLVSVTAYGAVVLFELALLLRLA